MGQGAGAHRAFAYTALFLIPLGGLLVLIAAQLGPETRAADLLVHQPPALESERAAVRVSAPRPEREVATRS